MQLLKYIKLVSLRFSCDSAKFPKLFVLMIY